MLILASLFTIFQYSFSGLQIINLLFPILIVVCGRPVSVRRADAIVMLVFSLLVTLSLICFGMTEKWNYDTRSVIQLVFTLQYIFFAFDFSFDYPKLFKCLYVFGVMLGALIIILFFLTGTFRIPNFYTSARLWASFLPAWPTSIVAPLAFSLWLALFRERSIKGAAIIILGLILTTSRAGLFCAIGLPAYKFVASHHAKIRKITSLRLIVALAAILLGAFLILRDNQLLLTRLFVSHDRISIFNTVWQLISQKPLLGYGGNTFDQILPIFSVDTGSWVAQQTHNAPMEIALRYGIPACLLFCAFFAKQFLRIKDRDVKVLFLLLILLSLTQDYVRNFSFLFCLYLAAHLDSPSPKNLERCTDNEYKKGAA